MGLNKRAIYFTIDAIIALTVVIALLIVAIPMVNYQNPTNKIHYDTLSVISNLKIGDFNNALVQGWIAQGIINDTSKTVLEQIAEFSFTDTQKAKALSSAVLDNIPSSKNIGIWIINQQSGSEQLLSSKNVTPYNNETNELIDVTRQTITTIREGENVTGFSSRAFLSSANQVKYYYFGGYVGDGNITIPLNFSGSVQQATIKLTANTNFTISINGISTSYPSSRSEYSPDIYELDKSRFVSGQNIIKLSGMYSERLRISGGYIKIVYNTSEVYSRETKKYLPGINGIINLYDGFFVPNTLNNLSAHLHFNSTDPLNFTIANVTVFTFSGSPNEQIVDLNNAALSTMFNYNDLSNKTVPYRFYNQGSNATRIGNADIILITDVSGSMNWTMVNDSDGFTRNCTDAKINDPSTKRLSLAKCIDKEFVSYLINITGNNISLVSFSTNSDNTQYIGLTKNITLLNKTIDAYTALVTTCISCAINRAYLILQNQSTDPTRDKFIIVMTDGVANVRSTTTCGANYQGTSTTGLSCSDNDACSLTTSYPALNANFSSCRVHNNLGATVFSIGFGPVATCQFGNSTLQAIANCGAGKFYSSSNATELRKIYNEIAQTILKVSYKNQIANVTLGFRTELFSDSYLKFGFDEPNLPAGIILSSEIPFSNTTSGSLTVPQNSTILDATVISYSGPLWTSIVKINNNVIYNLSRYGTDFTSLGDPFSVNIPISAINTSAVNQITLLTGIGPGNFSSGSINNSIIYTIAKDIPSFNSTFLFSSAKGCNWTIQFQGQPSTLTMPIPSTYSGSNICLYTPGNRCSNIDPNDAIQQSICQMLNLLDLNGDGQVDIPFNQQNLGIDTSSITGIPFKQRIEVQIRTWS